MKRLLMSKIKQLLLLQTLNPAQTVTSDQLRTLILNFYDAIIIEKNAQKGFRPKKVSNGTVSTTISPMSDAFSRSVNF
ncbi:MAG: hypothetical protein ACTTKN_06825 [Phocaeicola sp.]|uniref:hypothetical protein n=1 Tax=Phocaeicola TaxID=909656 RepID=UPI00234EF287|nr:hypothetical protein [Phocaeicola oris]MCE2617617.1 hypothetical protein [Phocaeicola oris]